jgi:hypothetical protein
MRIAILVLIGVALWFAPPFLLSLFLASVVVMGFAGLCLAALLAFL